MACYGCHMFMSTLGVNRCVFHSIRFLAELPFASLQMLKAHFEAAVSVGYIGACITLQKLYIRLHMTPQRSYVRMYDTPVGAVHEDVYTTLICIRLYHTQETVHENVCMTAEALHKTVCNTPKVVHQHTCVTLFETLIDLYFRESFFFFFKASTLMIFSLLVFSHSIFLILEKRSGQVNHYH